MDSAPPAPAAVRVTTRAVLAAGLVSTAALGWAALALVEAPDDAARLALSRLAAQVDQALAAELPTALSQLEPDPTDLAVDGPPPAPRISPRELDGGAEQRSAFATLLRQAERLELVDGHPEQARPAAEQALAAARDPGERALARLRLVQLAARLGARDDAARLARAALDELPTDASRDGLSWRLLVGLAAGPALSAGERRRLVQDWLEGRLPDGAGAPTLAVADDGSVTLEEPATRRALRDRLEALLPEDERPAFADRARQLAAGRALATLVGADGPPEAAEATGWCVTAWPDAGVATLSRRGDRTGEPRTLVVSLTGLARRLREHLAAAAVLPPGFDLRLDLDPPEVRSALAGAEALRPAVSLPERGLSWTLVHTDVAGQLESLASRSSWQRTGLLLAAAFALVATVVAVVALAREARLAALKSAFVASVSHELRTPVAAIQLLTENLERGRVSDVARYHAALRQEGRRLGRLVDDVLDLSRLERGRPPRLEPQPHGVGELVAFLLEEARAHVEGTGARLTLEPDGLPPGGELDADREALRRCLLNLLDNALRHGAGPAPPVLSVRVAGSWLELVVRDHGPGLPASRRSAVLRPFVQGEGTSTGAGLGLAIVRTLVEAHGGRLALVDPASGPGLEVRLALPLADDGDTDPDDTQERSA